MKLSYRKLNKGLNVLNKKEVIEFASMLYKKYVLEEDNLDYTKISDATRGLLFLTIGVNYNNMHPTKKSRKKEDTTEWFRKIGAIPEA